LQQHRVRRPGGRLRLIGASRTLTAQTTPMSSCTVTTIDFLPADFYAERRRRSVRRGRWMIAAAFLALTVLGFAGNRLQGSRLQAELDQLTPQVAGVVKVRNSLSQLTQQIQHLEQHADVSSRLRFRPLTTRLLASVTAAIPENLTLQELEIRREQPIAALTSPNRNAKQENDDVKTPEQSDLDRLVAEQSRQILTLRGFAPNDATVSEYLVRLRRTEVFDDVTLLYTDHADREGVELRTFSVRLRVRPAWNSFVANAVPNRGAL